VVAADAPALASAKIVKNAQLVAIKFINLGIAKV